MSVLCIVLMIHLLYEGMQVLHWKETPQFGDNTHNILATVILNHDEDIFFCVIKIKLVFATSIQKVPSVYVILQKETFQKVFKSRKVG